MKINKFESNIRLEQIQQWAKNNNADIDFINLAIPNLYQQCSNYGINQLFTIAQSVYETGWGKYQGQVKKDSKNLCGLKNAYGTDFQTFETYEFGAMAHVEHIGLYIGLEGFPLAEPKDTRHFDSLLGTGTTLIKLCKEWTKSETYNLYYARIMEMIEEIELTEIVDSFEVVEEDKKVKDSKLKEDFFKLKEQFESFSNLFLENIK